MFDRREKNAQIFQDTCEMIRESKRLQEAVKNSIHNQKMYPHGFADTDLKNKNLIAKEGEIVVSEKRTLEAAEVYAKADKKVCVLNFASATNPGGGVKRCIDSWGFGCGAFRNPPEVVAQLFEEATEKYRTSFDTIEFAVFHTPKDTKDYDAFAEVFQ